MSKEYLADKPTLDEVNEKMGDAEGSSIFAKLNSIISAIADHVAIWTAAKAGNLDTTVSSRAPANTALSTAQWTNTRAGYLDNINTKANNLDSRLTAARAGYLDKLNSGVAIGSLSGKIVKSVQRGTAAISTKSVTIDISEVDISKAIVLLDGVGVNGGSSSTSGGAPHLSKFTSTALTIAPSFSYASTTPTYSFSWQVIEFY